MSAFVGYLDGGKTDKEGLKKELSRLFTKGNPINLTPTSMQVVQRAAGANMSVDVSIGDVHIPIPTGGYSYWAWTDAATNVVVSTSSPSNPRIDVVYAWIDTTAFTAGSNNNPGALKFGISTGTAASTPVANSDATIQIALGASVPFIRLATVLVGTSVTSIANAVITDARTTIQLTTTSNVSVTNTGWSPLSTTLSALTYNGNRSYTATTSNDLTGTLPPGNRLMFTRSTGAPTQSTNLNGTTQFWNNTTPAGMVFTDDFVVSAWVKLSSYPAVGGVIASRYNGTSGWTFQIQPTGQVLMGGYNGGVGNLSYILSYQSVPLNKWVHVTAQLDMSTFTATTATSYVMLDGVDVPATPTRIGTNPTALVQAGNLEIGSQNSGVLLFPGKIAQVAIYSAKVTQANIRNTISQGLTGSETSLISAYSFNASANDLNLSNANNLTANGAAVATNADSPFGGQANGTISATLDYGILESITSSSITFQVPEGCAVTTTGALSSISYSNVKSPFGMPTQRVKWTITAGFQTTLTKVSPTSGTWYNMGSQITIPIGEWNLGYQVMAYTVAASALAASMYADMNISASAGSTTSDWGARVYFSQSSGGIPSIVHEVNKTAFVSISAQIVYYLNALTDIPTTSTINFLSGAGTNVITLENAYL